MEGSLIGLKEIGTGLAPCQSTPMFDMLTVEECACVGERKRW
jgi:hypothetical protein